MRIATFNIQHGRGSDGDVDLDRLAAATALLDADILGLQEVDVGVARSHGADLAAIAAGPMAVVFGPAMALRHGWYGNALAVRGDIGEVDLLPLPSEEGDEPRAAIIARASPADGPDLTVAVTHLSVRTHVARLQLEAVLALLLERRPPLVLLGDLNLTPRLVTPAVAAAGLTLADAAAPTFPAAKPRLRIDHVAASGEMALANVAAVRAPVSDHCALLVNAV